MPPALEILCVLAVAAVLIAATLWVIAIFGQPASRHQPRTRT